MNTLDIFCFTSVARTRSFSITARELLISQQAVSRHIKCMEDELGFPLFLRNYQSVQLTEAGKLMLSFFMERDALITDFQNSIKRDASPACIHIGLSQWLGCTDGFQHTLDRFSARFPSVQICIHELTAREVRDMLLQERLDFLLTTRYAASFLPVDWRVRVLSEEAVVLLGSARRPFIYSQSSSYQYFASFSGETDTDTAAERLRALLAGQDIQAERLGILPDMGSVCLNVLLKKGFSPAVRRRLSENNADYSVMPLDRSVTAVLCMPYIPASPAASELARMACGKEASK